MPALNSVAANRARIVRLSDAVQRGQWTTYGTIGEVVYGPGCGAQTVGSVMREEGLERSAHRVLRAGGKISRDWIGNGGGPEECRRRLRNEGVWDERRDRARADAYVDADALRALGV